ncbi:36875_t:CDS:10, partial [Racocetra persica]
ESIVLRDGNDELDMNGMDKNSMLFGGTKVLQVTPPQEDILSAPDNGCIAYVIRTGFGTAQGKLVRTMVYSVEDGRKRSKLLLDCILIITSVVPPELPMELSLAVNTSLVALAKFGETLTIYCTEPFRIPFAGKIDVCAFDKTGTLTGENLEVEGIAGIHPEDSKILVKPPDALRESIQTLAAAHALVKLDDGIVGDPMEKATLEALDWKLGKGDTVIPANQQSQRFQQRSQLQIRRRFQFSSALKRMSSVSTIPTSRLKKTFVAVKGAPETLRNMYVYVPDDYEETFKFFMRRGSRVLALGYKYLKDNMNMDEINELSRESVESELTFAGFLIFHCPLKDDAVSTLEMLNESSHRVIMITGDNPLTACHVAREVKILERDVLILDLREDAQNNNDLVWKSVDEKVIIPVNPAEPVDLSVYRDYDLCITGAALACYENKPSVKDLLVHTWVYARVSPGQKEFILTVLKQAGYITLMCGDGTNDVGALKQAHVGVALLDGKPEDLKKIAEHQRIQRLKDVYEIVPPELPMELSLAVNTSLVALAKFGETLTIYCTEPFRIPFAGKIDVCAFDKTGTLTGENLEVEGIAGIHPEDSKILVKPPDALRESIQTLAAAHALVKLDDGIVGDPMEKATLEALDWKLGKGDTVIPANQQSQRFQQRSQLQIRRRFQFSSALKRMSSVSTIPTSRLKKTFVAVKGAPETLRNMYVYVPDDYEETFKFFMRRGSRVLALGYKYLKDNMNMDEINELSRESVESELTFAGFLIFHCPLKDDAVSTLEMLNESSHRVIMITGDNPLTACHVAREVKILERDVLILDLREDAQNNNDLVWKSVDEKVIIPVNPAEPVDLSVYRDYDLCITGAALACYENKPSVKDLLVHTWVYARVSPGQKEFILTVLKQAGYITLMCGDGTNDVGALKQAHVGVALLDGKPEDLKKIAEHQRIQRLKDVYESQLKFTSRFNMPPPPPPPAIAHLFPHITQQLQQQNNTGHGQRRPPPQMDQLAEHLLQDFDDEPPTIKLGDASVAAPFTSKLSNVVAIANIVRQGRCTLVATIQMYKILALNCLISAYSLSVLYLEGIKYGDLQVTISGMLLAVCFLCISKAKPLERLAKQRPQTNVFNFYIILSILGQFAIHIASLVYIVDLVFRYEERTAVDLEGDFKPSLLNTAVYLISLSMQVSTFAINYQGHPFRESLKENTALYYGLLSVGAIALSGATEFIPEMNSMLQLVPLKSE